MRRWASWAGAHCGEMAAVGAQPSRPSLPSHRSRAAASAPLGAPRHDATAPPLTMQGPHGSRGGRGASAGCASEVAALQHGARPRRHTAAIPPGDLAVLGPRAHGGATAVAGARVGRRPRGVLRAPLRPVPPVRGRVLRAGGRLVGADDHGGAHRMAKTSATGVEAPSAAVRGAGRGQVLVRHGPHGGGPGDGAHVRDLRPTKRDHGADEGEHRAPPSASSAWAAAWSL